MVTVITVAPILPENDALIVEVPRSTAEARPCDPAAFEMIATLSSDDAQVTCEVRFWVVLSV